MIVKPILEAFLRLLRLRSRSYRTAHEYPLRIRAYMRSRAFMHQRGQHHDIFQAVMSLML